MFVDASVIIAIMTSEARAENLAAMLDSTSTDERITSVLAAWEAAVGLFRKKGIPMAEAEALVREFLEAARITIKPVTDAEMTIALQAFERYGRHRCPDNERNSALNLADCFHYATAKSHRASMLTEDAGFALTDVASLGPDL